MAIYEEDTGGEDRSTAISYTDLWLFIGITLLFSLPPHPQLELSALFEQN